ncbi:hypothetical protein GBAR_LOCUS31427 [Geodia barretti]|uniref:Uncharacterized protein n=1 Tax=Geodia barretti TaxID=519541 RepID=A0AA35U046_GEOBA|nr:hypothetical protein GBAR_LOCUS31427 [Geodia barretti]
MVLIFLAILSFQLHHSVLTDCPIEGCKVCDSSVESCDECLEEKARFDPKSNSCTTISGQDMQVTVIIGVVIAAAVILAIVVIIVSVLVYYRRRRRNKMFKLNYEVARSDSAELFDRIHTTFPLADTTYTSKDDASESTKADDEEDASKLETNETKKGEEDESKHDTNETKKGEAGVTPNETKKEADASKDDTAKANEADGPSKDDASETTVAMVDGSKDKSSETTVATNDATKRPQCVWFMKAKMKSQRLRQTKAKMKPVR